MKPPSTEIYGGKSFLMSKVESCVGFYEPHVEIKLREIGLERFVDFVLELDYTTSFPPEYTAEAFADEVLRCGDPSPERSR